MAIIINNHPYKKPKTEIDLSEYAKKSDIPEIPVIDLSQYALKTELPQNYLTEIPQAGSDVIGGVKKTTVTSALPGTSQQDLVKLYNDLLVKLVDTGLADDGDFVDLGLPSGTLWARCNYGAANPEDSGLYVQFADTQGYYYKNGAILDMYGNPSTKTFSYSDCIYVDPIGGQEVTKYFFDLTTYQGQITLLPEDDILNNTKYTHSTGQQVTELFKNSTVVEHTLNGVLGIKVTSNLNGNYIFLPYSGHLDGTAVKDFGADLYWYSTSVSFTNPTQTNNLRSNSGSMSGQTTTTFSRWNGTVIRPVKR